MMQGIFNCEHYRYTAIIAPRLLVGLHLSFFSPTEKVFALRRIVAYGSVDNDIGINSIVWRTVWRQIFLAAGERLMLIHADTESRTYWNSLIFKILHERPSQEKIMSYEIPGLRCVCERMRIPGNFALICRFDGFFRHYSDSNTRRPTLSTLVFVQPIPFLSRLPFWHR